VNNVDHGRTRKPAGLTFYSGSLHQNIASPPPHDFYIYTVETSNHIGQFARLPSTIEAVSRECCEKTMESSEKTEKGA
jgi:hypothetical protein